ncbi:MAG: hypothetical protein LIO62_03700 [Clostridiales bacterium]|nr:hypothetical protein [Clostridiales bacterium]
MSNLKNYRRRVLLKTAVIPIIAAIITAVVFINSLPTAEADLQNKFSSSAVTETVVAQNE